MTSIRSGFLVAAIVSSALVAAGCSSHPAPSVGEAFAVVRLGMASAEVEALLGRPLLRRATEAPPGVGGDEAWYLPPPQIEPVESPWGSGAICITYSAEGRVVAKALNPQCRPRVGP